MRHRIGGWIRIGLFAAVPAAWGGVAAAQGAGTSGSSGVAADSRGINPIADSLGSTDSSHRTDEQKKAGMIDDQTPLPVDGRNDIDRSLGKSPSAPGAGTSGSAGAVGGSSSKRHKKQRGPSTSDDMTSDIDK